MFSLSSRSFLLGLLVAGSLGCASTAAPPRAPDPSFPREPEPTPVSPVPTATPLSFTYRDGVYAYDLQQVTIVTVGGTGAPSVEDTLRTRAGLTYSVSSSTGVPVLSVTIDSLTIMSVRDTMAAVRHLTAPVTVSQSSALPAPLVTAEDSAAFLSGCDSMEETARTLAGDVHMQIPVPIQETRSWTDSTSSVICRGAIPLTVIRVSHYRISSVRERRDSVLATVTRQTSLTVNGIGTQGTRRITVRGEGTSDALFTYDVRGGRFLESAGSSVLQLGFETIQQTEQVVQRSTSNVRLRSATPGGN